MGVKFLLCSWCFVWGVIAIDETCADYGAVQHDTTISGDLLAKVQALSVDDCCALCSDQADCEGYVFHLDQCYLKKNLGATSAKPDAMTRLKSICGAYAPPLPNVDMSGVLLAKLQASDMSKCCAMCDSTTGCEGYVFHLDQCYLKRGLASPSTKVGATTRLKYGSWGKESAHPGKETPFDVVDQTCGGYGAVERDTDISGTQLAKISAQSSADCCALCDDLAECEGYVFHLDQCYLKKELGAKFFKQDAMTRVRGTCEGYSTPLVDVDMSGELLAKIEASESRHCCTWCQSMVGCEGFVFHLDQCYLKKSLSSVTAKSKVVTRLRLVPSSHSILRGSSSSPP